MEIDFFEQIIIKFRKYSYKMELRKEPKFNYQLAEEVDKRLNQLDYLYKNIVEKQTEYLKLSVKLESVENTLRKHLPKRRGTILVTKSDDTIRMEKLWLEIELFTESFYYIAHRIWQIAQSYNEPLPYLKSFTCKGVRDVRNKLLEHPEKVKEGPIYIQSFRIGGEQGPTLKIQREIGQQDIYPDKGLYENAAEFRINFERLLDSVLNEK